MIIYKVSTTSRCPATGAHACLHHEAEHVSAFHLSRRIVQICIIKMPVQSARTVLLPLLTHWSYVLHLPSLSQCVWKSWFLRDVFFRRGVHKISWTAYFHQILVFIEAAWESLVGRSLAAIEQGTAGVQADTLSQGPKSGQSQIGTKIVRNLQNELISTH